MPATEETYRSQPTLHIAFALTSIAMTLSIVWMIMADHLRPWKEVQRDFHKLEVKKLEAVEERKLEDQRQQSQAKIDKLDAEMKAAEESAAAHRSELRKVEAEIKLLGGKYELLDTKKKFQKAELDSLRSLYDGIIDRGEEYQARVFLGGSIVPAENKYNALALDFEKADEAMKAARAKQEELLGNIDKLQKQKDDLTRASDNAKRTVIQKKQRYEGFPAWVRNLPFIDLAAPPEKIQQISLPELTINYNFKDVPRYDRCGTCHQGIDKPGYELDAEGKPMPRVFASHPHLTEGATAFDPTGKVVKAGLYLDGNGPHSMNAFGCTICHGGQGSGTDFTYASHTPADLHEKARWTTDRHWQEIHHWDEPMLPKRFIESSCIKCHHEVTDVPQAPKLQAGYERIVKYGCTGCHTIGGPGSFGPDLTDEKQVGPNLEHLGSKVSKDWALKWIKDPHAFRPDSRMPRFYGVTNNNDKKDWPKNHAEIHAIAHYLFAKSTPPADFVDPPAKSDPAHGKDLFLQKGCLACHSHRPYETSEVQLADKAALNPKYKPDPASTYAPSGFPESVQQYARANHGPNLSNIAAKFQSSEQGYKWLANWIKAPERYHPKSLMPNLQLSDQDAADLAAWIISVPGEWPVLISVPDAGSDEVKDAVDDLVKLFVSKGGYLRDGKLVPVALSEVDSFVKNKLSENEKLMFLGEKTISRLGCFGCHSIPGFETAKPIGTALNGWGAKSPTKLDYGHIAEYLDDQREEIRESPSRETEGYDLRLMSKVTNASDLTTAGSNLVIVADVENVLHFRIFDGNGKMVVDTDENRLPTQAGPIAELKKQLENLWPPHMLTGAEKDRGITAVTLIVGRTQTEKFRDGTDEYFQEQLADHTRAGFLFQKLHRPRSYDYKKTNEDLKSWDDRLRMPQFAFANDPKAIEEIMTFLLGLTAEKINARYLPKTHYSASQTAVARGDKLLNRYNCTGCHVLEMPKYTVLPGVKFDDAFIKFPSKVNRAYTDRSSDYLKELYPDLTYDPKKEPVLDPPGAQPVVIEGMPIDLYENTDESPPVNELTIKLWRPVTIRGFNFQVGDTLTVDQAKVSKTEPVGGNFAWLYSAAQAEKNPGDFEGIWNRLPPPLLREGLKVQTPWLMAFLRNPYPIRPMVNLRMPRFHFGSIPTNDAARETTELANSFAARDKAEFPYQQVPERTREYLSRAESQHKGYLNGGWQIMTKGACKDCHAIGSNQPTGGQEAKNGPDLRQVGDRFRPGYLEEWLANPKRLLPYTVMPQNIEPEGKPRPLVVPDSFEGKPRIDMVKAARDTLLNYVNAVEQQLAGAAKPDEKAPAPAPAPKAEGGSD